MEQNGNFFKTEYQLLASEMEDAPSGALTWKGAHTVLHAQSNVVNHYK